MTNIHRPRKGKKEVAEKEKQRKGGYNRTKRIKAGRPRGRRREMGFIPSNVTKRQRRSKGREGKKKNEVSPTLEIPLECGREKGDRQQRFNN